MAKEKKAEKAEPAKLVKPADIGRNEPCYCGSGKKYKKCHLLQDDEVARKASLERAKTEKALEPEKVPEKKEHEKHDKKSTFTPVRQNSNTATKTLFRRKMGDG